MALEAKLRVGLHEQLGIRRLMRTVAGSAFAAPHISIGVGIGTPGYYAPAPVPYVAARPPMPGPGYIWIDGYYDAYGQFVPGYWSMPPYAGAYWVTPRYYGGRYYSGYWNGPRGYGYGYRGYDRDDFRYRGRDYGRGYGEGYRGGYGRGNGNAYGHGFRR